MCYLDSFSEQFHKNMNWNRIIQNLHINKSKKSNKLLLTVIRVFPTLMWRIIMTSVKSVIIFKKSIKPNDIKDNSNGEMLSFVKFLFSLNLTIYDSLESYLKEMIPRKRLKVVTYFNIIALITTTKAFIKVISANNQFVIKITGDYTYNLYPRHDIMSMVIFLIIFALTLLSR